MQNNSVAEIEKQVDKSNYNVDDLVSIKTTLNLPYYSGSNNYERAYGSVTIEGKDYEYVMRRVYKDTLELLCLPNYTKTRLQAVSNELCSVASDAQATGTNKKSSTVLKISMPDFFQQDNPVYTSSLPGFQKSYCSYISNLAPAGYTSLQERPPQI